MARSGVVAIAMAVVTLAGCASLNAGKPFNVVETGIPELQNALAEGRITSHQLVTEYLTHIAIYEDQLKAIITVNPRVLEEADARSVVSGEMLNADICADVLDTIMPLMCSISSRQPPNTPFQPTASRARSGLFWQATWQRACGS